MWNSFESCRFHVPSSASPSVGKRSIFSAIRTSSAESNSISEQEPGESRWIRSTESMSAPSAGKCASSSTSWRMKAAGKRTVRPPFRKVRTTNLNRLSTPSKIPLRFSKPKSPVISFSANSISRNPVAPRSV